MTAKKKSPLPDETWTEPDYVVPPHTPTQDELDFFARVHSESLRKRCVQDWKKLYEEGLGK